MKGVLSRPKIGSYLEGLLLHVQHFLVLEKQKGGTPIHSLFLFRPAASFRYWTEVCKAVFLSLLLLMRMLIRASLSEAMTVLRTPPSVPSCAAAPDLAFVKYRVLCQTLCRALGPQSWAAAPT